MFNGKCGIIMIELGKVVEVFGVSVYWLVMGYKDFYVMRFVVWYMYDFDIYWYINEGWEKDCEVFDYIVEVYWVVYGSFRVSLVVLLKIVK